MKGLVTSVYWFAQSFFQNSKKDILEHFHFAVDIWTKYCFAIFSLLYTYYWLYNQLEQGHNLQELVYNHQDIRINTKITCITSRNH